MRIVTFRRARDAMAAGWRSGDPFTWANASGGRRSRVVLAPRPWRQVGGRIPPATVASKAAHRREREVSRKTIGRGKPGCLGCTCQTRVRCFAVFAHGAAGAVGARLSLRPLHKRGTTRLHNSGENLPRECEALAV